MNQILQGDALAVLKTLPGQSIQACVTSPPYFGLRDYGVVGQFGLEKTPEAYVQKLVELFREVRRVLRDDGTLWLNLGDSYAGSGKGGQSEEKRSKNWQPIYPKSREGYDDGRQNRDKRKRVESTAGLKPKDLIGIPWRVAFALQADGWYLRQDIIWHKPNPMPESVTDRCTKAHEYIFLLSKSPTYYYDHGAVAEPAQSRPVDSWEKRKTAGAGSGSLDNGHNSSIARGVGFSHNLGNGQTRNRRSVWTVSTKPYRGAHFAAFPPALIEPMVIAGAPPGGVVLDPFLGSGTTAAVAQALGRAYLGIELNPAYIVLAEARLAQTPVPLLNL